MAASISARSGPYWAWMSIRGTAIGGAGRYHARRGGRAGAAGRTGSWLVLGGKGDRDGRPEPLAGGGRGPAAEPFGDVLDDRQPEAGAAEALRPRRVGAIEALEHVRQVALGDPRAVVGDRQRHGVALARAPSSSRVAPGPGVLDRVLHQVAHHRGGHAVGERRPGRPVGVERRAHPVLLGQPLQVGDRDGGRLGQVAARGRGQARGRLQLGQEQDVRDQRLQPLGLARGPRDEVAPRLRVHLGSSSASSSAAQPGQRRAQLVGDVGDELGAQLLVGDRLALVGQEHQRLARLARPRRARRRPGRCGARRRTGAPRSSGATRSARAASTRRARRCSLKASSTAHARRRGTGSARGRPGWPPPAGPSRSTRSATNGRSCSTCRPRRSATASSASSLGRRPRAPAPRRLGRGARGRGRRPPAARTATASRTSATTTPPVSQTARRPAPGSLWRRAGRVIGSPR